jgi:hypothetical protein
MFVSPETDCTLYAISKKRIFEPASDFARASRIFRQFPWATFFVGEHVGFNPCYVPPRNNMVARQFDPPNVGQIRSHKIRLSVNG